MGGFKKGDRVEFRAGRRTYQGKFVRKFYPARNAGPHYRIRTDGGMDATIFANGKVGLSVKHIEEN